MSRHKWSVLLLALMMVAGACSSAEESGESTTTTGSDTTTTSGSSSETTESTDPADDEEAGESVLRFAVLQEFEPIFHPVQASSAQVVAQNLLFNRLVEWDPSDPSGQSIMDGLAESWEAAPDASQFTFELREDVTWHDGEPFDAEDVLFTINWTLQNLETFGTFVPQWVNLAGAQEVIDAGEGTASGAVAVDDFTVELTLAEPNAEFLSRLADTENSILPQHVLMDETAATIRTSDFTLNNPIGTGPYQMVEVAPDQYLEMAANPSYFRGAPQIDRVFHVLTEEASAYAQLESGELDLVMRVAPGEAQRLEQIDGIEVGSVQGPGVVRLDLRNESPLFDDPRERQAVAHAINREGLVESLLQGQATVLHINPGFMQFEDIVNTYPYDPDRARELLEEADFPFDETVRLMYPQERPGYNEIFAVVAQNLQDVGMNVELLPLANDIWIDYLRFQRDEWDINVTTGGSELLSPDRSAVYFDCQYEGERGEWQTGYRNCDLDQLFVDGRTVSDPEAREEIYRAIAEILTEDMPAVHLYSPSLLYAKSTALGGGFTINTLDQYFNNIETWTIGG